MRLRRACSCSWLLARKPLRAALLLLFLSAGHGLKIIHGHPEFLRSSRPAARGGDRVRSRGDETARSTWMWRSWAPAWPGLSAALELQRAGRSFVVLEARDRAGGRLESRQIADGVWIDVGGQWVGPTQDRLYALAREHGAATFPTWTAGENVVELSGRLTRYTGTIPKLRPHVMADVGQAMARLDRMARRCRVEAPWNAPKAKQWDSQTVWSWMRRNMATPTGREMMEIAVKAVWAAMPADVSLLHLLFYISSAGNFDLLLDTEGGAQQDRFVEGAGTLAGRVAESLGDQVMLRRPVRRIEWSRRRRAADGRRRSTCAPRARSSRCRRRWPGRIAYDPPLPGYRDQLTQRVPMGAVIKCFAIYDEPFWRADGLSGSTVSGTGPLTLTVDNSPPSAARRASWSASSRAITRGRSAARPQRERRAAVLANLVRCSARARAAGALHREELGGGGVEPRLLRGLHAARRADRVRPRAARADRPDPLGRHRDRDEVERLHRRRDPVGRARGARGAWSKHRLLRLQQSGSGRLARCSPAALRWRARARLPALVEEGGDLVRQPARPHAQLVQRVGLEQPPVGQLLGQHLRVREGMDRVTRMPEHERRAPRRSCAPRAAARCGRRRGPAGRADEGRGSRLSTVEEDVRVVAEHARHAAQQRRQPGR